MFSPHEEVLIASGLRVILLHSISLYLGLNFLLLYQTHMRLKDLVLRMAQISKMDKPVMVIKKKSHLISAYFRSNVQ